MEIQESDCQILNLLNNKMMIYVAIKIPTIEPHENGEVHLIGTTRKNASDREKIYGIKWMNKVLEKALISLTFDYKDGKVFTIDTKRWSEIRITKPSDRIIESFNKLT